MSYAQDFGAQLLVGANFSQVDGDQFAGYNKLGVNAGIQINRPINSDWESAFEIRYSMKGSKKVIDPEGPPTETIDLNYHYLEVPFLVKYLGWKKIEPYGGLSLGVNTFNERDENGRKTKIDRLKKTEIGFHLGGSYALNKRTNIDLRHSYSLFSIRDYQVTTNSPSLWGRVGWFNRLFTVGISYDLKS
tara:strand:- start:22600 stop:23166 length:567 start_codon:yes stop_codon:yes gene_type:complete